jgi:hypothetical protein
MARMAAMYTGKTDGRNAKCPADAGRSLRVLRSQCFLAGEAAA